ncbi:MAG: cation:proton antiporter [Lachnospiraceae bacterium]|nr:cation:proton antiporter [Lachnospiraceae bacterium]
MQEYKFLLDIALILTLTKALGLFSKRISLPPVVGALIAGVLLGPIGINVIEPTSTITALAEIGVIVLMFQAGLETDIDELKESGLAAFIIALIGVLVPLIGGFAVAQCFNSDIMENIFIGVILTATSVSITVQTLQEMGKLKGKVGTSILGAAIIDDVLGVVLLSIITSVGSSGGAGISSILMTIGRLAAFLALAGIGGIGVYRFFHWLESRGMRKRRIPVFAFAFCLFLSFFAELFGIADITGAYMAGVVLCRTNAHDYINRKVECVSYMLITPIFFANIGLKTTISGMSSTIVLFTVLLCAVAIISKMIGCGVGAKLCGYTNKESLQIGVGMISRGEVALIVAEKGLKVGIMPPELFSPIVIVVVITTLLTPILLRVVFTEKSA